ncbi:MAG TPA: hypothetical protein VJO33_19665 [Gemmatimonadaceae bacterium]|nr:hypothetical protein [Gemmatimonadaceae bacterium]
MTTRVFLKPYSVNGTGIRLLDYQRVSADSYEATRWFTFFFIPLIPIGTWLIRPGTQEGIATSMKYNFQILGNRPLKWKRVGRLWLFNIVAALPVTAFALLEKPGSDNPNMGFALLMLSVLWMFGALWYGQRKTEQPYHAPATQPMPTGGSSPRKAA